MIIKDKDTWWKVLDSNWTHIIYTIPSELNYDLSGLASDTLQRDGKLLDGKTTFLGDLLKSKENRNYERLLTYLNAFWAAAPDQPYIHSIPGWGALCDLCSENWVFYEEESFGMEHANEDVFKDHIDDIED